MRLAVAAVAALALAAAACGGVESEPNLAKAAERTEETGSFAFEMTMRFTEAGDDAETSCDGVVDSVRQRERLVCSGGSEMVTVDRMTYVRDSSDEKWWKSPTGDDTIEEFSPESILRLLRSASRKTERVGEEDVRGEPTVQYALTVDCEQAEIYDCAGGNSVVDVWIDDEGLVRRVAYHEEGGVTTNTEFFAFGQPVEIEAPPDIQVEQWAVPPEVPCTPEKAGPIGVGRASEALGRAGFDMRPDKSLCGEGIAAQLTNLNDADPAFDALAESDGYLICTIRTRSRNAMWFTLLPSWQGAPDHVSRSLENLHCTLWAEGPQAQERIAALEAAIDELRRQLDP